jgi:stearoyl-CoA desaturase (delta-9 desaturase)
MKILEANIHDVTFIQIVTTIVAIASLFFIVPSFENILLIIVGYFLYSCIGMVIFYHRYWSHKSFKTWSIIETIGTLLGALAGRGSALSWVTVHRLHHTHTDSDLDPHWSDRDGWKIFFPFLLAYDFQKINPFMIKDILSSKIVMFVHNNYRLILLAYLVVLGIIGLNVLLYFWIFPAALTAWSLNTFVYLSHRNSQPVNSWLVSLLLWGEGWHVLHHEKPGYSNIQDKWYRVDLAGYVISLIRKKNV